ncbi:MAG: glycosyltransferase family 39 protein [Spirochaetales bacterium]|nr:glycosyltransferase family 39 protein [Spirochaetales bacterium]
MFNSSPGDSILPLRGDFFSSLPHRSDQKQGIFPIYLLLWFSINLLFLQGFPFLHTDEPWLSGLSRTMGEEKNPGATEDFFDLYERHPHGIKILYHGIQIFFFRLFGYSLFTARLVSLCAAAVSLILFHRILLHLGNGKTAFFVTLLFSWDIQFIYAAHMARQEMMILTFMLAGLLLYVLKRKSPLPGPFLFMGLLTGLALGVHPNAFVVAWPMGLLLLRDLLLKRIGPLQAFCYLGSAATAAIVFPLISLFLNGNFFHDYGAFGQSVGAGDSLDLKMIRFIPFHRNLYRQIGGTYYLPNIKYFYLIFPPALLTLALQKTPGRDLWFSGAIGLSVGIALLGKYSQPSVIFYFPFFYGALFSLLSPLLSGNHRKKRFPLFPIIGGFLLMGLSLLPLAREVPREARSLSHYRRNLARTVPKDAVLLGGLALEYHREGGRLYDWRNLTCLEGESVETYLKERKIEYVVIPSELDLIYETRPVWNALYGNPFPWYGELMEFLEEEAERTASFPSPGYGTRIEAYRYRIPEETVIYRIPREDSTRE